MTSRKRYPPSQFLDIGPWRIDLERGVVSAREGTAALSPRAEELLVLLARYANLLVTREQILDTVWAGRVVEDGAITHCIWQIRKSLGDGGKEMVQTRAKRGYVLVVSDRDWVLDTENDGVLPAVPDAPIVALPSLEPVGEPVNGRTFETKDDRAPVSNSEQVSVMTETKSDAAKPPIESVPISTTASTATASTATASTTAFGAAVSGTPRPRLQWSRKSVGLFLAALIFALVCLPLAWRFLRASPESIALSPGIEMSVAVLAPESTVWLRNAVLREIFEYAHGHDIAPIVFQRAQTKNPFAGPHLQVAMTPASGAEIDAQLSLAQGDLVVRDRFRGAANGLAPAVQAFLVRTLGAAPAPTPQSDDYVSGLMAESRFDQQKALVEYRRAVARAPAMADARIGMARILFAQGRLGEASALVDALRADATLTRSQRCRFELLQAQIATAPVAAGVCDRARAIASVQRLQLRDALRQLQRLNETPMGAAQWLEEESATILALLRLDELEQAEYEIDRAERVARDAGWEHARIQIAASRGTLEMHRQRLQEAMRARTTAADAMDALGDTASAIENRIWAIRPMQIVPGPEVGRYRETLRHVIDRAREIGSVRTEIDALLLLARLDRDRVDLWNEHLSRIRRLVAQTGLDRQHTLDLYLVINETIFQQRYIDALAGLSDLEKSGNQHPRARAWDLMLRARASFARDALGDAVAAIDAMEKEGLDVPGSPDFCLLSWILAEADRQDRARAYLKRCQSNDFDRAAQALRGDIGLVAEARLHQRFGEAERAWPTLRPRIDALLALPAPTREEAESLALLARHASALPGVDPERLTRALTRADNLAKLDGAGPRLRLGVHLLRWRLCARNAGAGCGPILPAWSQEDRLEARLAQQAAAG